MLYIIYNKKRKELFMACLCEKCNKSCCSGVFQGLKNSKERQMKNLRLRALREEKGYTQQEFADKLGVTQQSYARWESGTSEPRIEILIKIADFYNISLDLLCNRPRENEGLSIEKIEIIDNLRKLDNHNTSLVRGFVLGLLAQKNNY